MWNDVKIANSRGSHLVRRLSAQNHVIVLDKLDYCASLKNIQGIDCVFIQENVQNFDFVSKFIIENRIEWIIHVAAQSHVDNSFSQSLHFTKNNVYGTHVLLEAARLANVERFLLISSDEVYGEQSDQDATENAPYSPSNPYAATKAAAECLAKAYFKSFKLPVIITRSNNIYGPMQYPEKIIPKFITLLIKEKSLPIHGDGSHKRKYLYIDDLVDALLLILERGVVGLAYNIPSNYEISNVDLAKKLLHSFGKDDDLIQHVSDRPFNDCRYSISGDLINSIGWYPKTSFDHGLAATVEWYKKHVDNWWDDISIAFPEYKN